MEKSSLLPASLARMFFDSGEFWLEGAGGGWATAAVLILVLCWQLGRAFSKRRSAAGDWAARTAPAKTPGGSLSTRISSMISDADLRYLIDILEGKNNEAEIWEEVIQKKNGNISYHAKCCRSKDGPMKYLSVAIFEKCSTDLLRDFYMDNEYRKKWDKTLVEYGQLQADETSGTEIGRMVKKFSLLTPREYLLAWRVWEGKEKVFYCFSKDCEHPFAPRQKKYIRVGFFRSGWRIRKVPGRDACEIAMLHQEDAGLNVEMARLVFSKGIWSYVCKMDRALREYTPHTHSRSPSVAAMHKLIQKVPPVLESDVEITSQDLSEISADGLFGRPAVKNILERGIPSNHSKWIANGLLLIGGIACLSRSRSTLGTQIALGCIVKKMLNRSSKAGQANPVEAAKSSRQRD